MSVAEPLVQASLLGEAIDPGPVAILVADETGRYIAANQFACDLLGYSREELLGMQVTDIAPDGAEDYADMLRTSSWNGVSTVSRKDGSTLEVRWAARETRVAGMAVYVSVGWPETTE
jgi:PAS domain S-box-containing protein